MSFTPSPQQAAVFEWAVNGTGSAVIEAVAGAGKTTTLIQMLQRTTGSVAFAAYNKKISDEIKAKVMPLGLDRVQVGTMHSFGFSAVRKAFPGVRTDGYKLRDMAKMMVEEGKMAPSSMTFAAAAASMAKQVGIGAVTTGINDDHVWYSMIDHYDLEDKLAEGGKLAQALKSAQELLVASNARTDIIDFDDMVYLPVLKRLRVWQHDWVLLDEAQDTNATRRALARMMLRPGGRLVAVGDPAQAIYGFTGADADSLDQIRRDFGAITLPLTVSYRCPKAVVAEARQWVDHIQPAETAEDGEVTEMSEEDFWGTRKSPGSFSGLSADDAILCRNAKPLVTLAYGLLRRGKGCLIEGRDIGYGLISLARKWKGARTIQGLRTRLEAWRDAEMARALAKKQDTRAASIADQAECLLEIMSQHPNDGAVQLVVDDINKLFGDTPAGQRPRVVTLSTIHKSKGREWHRVLWWGKAAYQPSRWARQEWQQGQERNLMYVAATRAQRTLVHVDVNPGADLAA